MCWSLSANKDTHIYQHIQCFVDVYPPISPHICLKRQTKHFINKEVCHIVSDVTGVRSLEKLNGSKYRY